jgi:hypothetical protein
VTALRSASEQVRLRVVVDGVGDLDAVASWADPARVGDEVRLRLDASRTAAVPAG